MATLIDAFSLKESVTGIELKINLLKNNKFDFCPNDADYSNWIPFEFCFKIGENESYIYPAEFGAQFSLEDLKNLIEGAENLFIAMENRGIEDWWDHKLKHKFFTSENYFGINFVDAYDGFVSVTIWIVMASLPNNIYDNFKRGIQFTATTDDVKKFIVELKNQLAYLIENAECTRRGVYGCKC